MTPLHRALERLVQVGLHPRGVSVTHPSTEIRVLLGDYRHEHTPVEVIGDRGGIVGKTAIERLPDEIIDGRDILPGDLNDLNAVILQTALVQRAWDVQLIYLGHSTWVEGHRRYMEGCGYTVTHSAPEISPRYTWRWKPNIWLPEGPLKDHALNGQWPENLPALAIGPERSYLFDLRRCA